MGYISKYPFCSIFRDLQDCHTFAPLEAANLSKNAQNFFASLLLKIAKFRYFSTVSIEFYADSHEISRYFAI